MLLGVELSRLRLLGVVLLRVGLLGVYLLREGLFREGLLIGYFKGVSL